MVWGGCKKDIKANPKKKTWMSKSIYKWYSQKKKKTYTAHHKSFKYFNLSSQKLIGLSKSWKLAPKNITSNGFMTQKKKSCILKDQNERTAWRNIFFISLSYYQWFIISYYIVISFLGHFFQDDFKCFKIIKFAYFYDQPQR